MTTKQISKQDLHAIMDEARRRFLDLAGPLQMEGDKGPSRHLNDGERLALCYLHGVLLTLSKNNLLCDGWEHKLSTETDSDSSEPATDD